MENNYNPEKYLNGQVSDGLEHTPRYHQDLLEEDEKRYIEMLRKAYTDSMTGCFNRNYFEMINKENIDPVKDNQNIVIDHYDINNLTDANKISYATGDQMIIDTTNHIMSKCGIKETTGKITGDEYKNQDIMIRIGGDEFITIHYKTEKEQLDPNYEIKHQNWMSENIYKNKPDTFDFAWGSSIFDNNIDRNIYDTSVRSGINMQEQKTVRKSFMQ